MTTTDFDQWFAAQSQKIQIEVNALVEVLTKLGPFIKRPWSDTLNGSDYANMKELRCKLQGQVIRIAYAFDPEQTAILLCAGEKQGVSSKRFYSALIRRADFLYDQHLRYLRNKE